MLFRHDILYLSCRGLYAGWVDHISPPLFKAESPRPGCPTWWASFRESGSRKRQLHCSATKAAGRTALKIRSERPLPEDWWFWRTGEIRREKLPTYSDCLYDCLCNLTYHGVQEKFSLHLWRISSTKDCGLLTHALCSQCDLSDVIVYLCMQTPNWTKSKDK